MHRIICSWVFAQFISGICGYAQELKATEDKTLLRILLTDLKGKPLANERMIVKGQKNGFKVSEKTDAAGKWHLLVPEGDIYQVTYITHHNSEQAVSVAVPLEDGAFENDLTLKYRPPKEFTLDNLYFDVNLTVIKPESFPELDELLEFLKIVPDVRIEIAGHTDNQGDDAANLKLSQARADAVRKYLLQKGIPPARVTAVGYGETKPIAGNETPEERKKNRRTTVVILD